jgi:phosphatidylserine decarboxylase precursor
MFVLFACQIKSLRQGSSYHLQDFLGFTPRLHAPTGASRLYFAVLYLAPGDYHHFHAAVDGQLNGRLHVPGTCVAAAPAVLRQIPRVLSANERVVLHGAWARGFFSQTAVGASNVGSIKLVAEPVLILPFFSIYWLY